MISCKFCGKELKNRSGLIRHIESCQLNPDVINGLYKCYCKYCGKECRSINSLTNHEVRCKSNPNRLILAPTRRKWSEERRKNTIAWNKGLTKETDERIANVAVRISNRYKEGLLISHQKGKPRTQEEKQKISNAMKNNPNAGGLRPRSGRGKKGWYKGYFCDSTYELVWIIYNLDHDIKFTRNRSFYLYEYEGEIHKYYPDFRLSDNSLVEIKGYVTGLVKIKIASVNDVPIKLLTERDLKYAFDWVKEHYTYNELKDLYEEG